MNENAAPMYRSCVRPSLVLQAGVAAATPDTLGYAILRQQPATNNQ
jgi:hypothetical protein